MAYRSPIFDTGMTVVAVGPDATPSRSIADGDPCDRCGGTRWTMSANPSRSFKQTMRCERCGRPRHVRLPKEDLED